jgi:hypothetical protein
MQVPSSLRAGLKYQLSLQRCAWPVHKQEGLFTGTEALGQDVDLQRVHLGVRIAPAEHTESEHCHQYDRAQRRQTPSSTALTPDTKKPGRRCEPGIRKLERIQHE